MKYPYVDLHTHTNLSDGTLTPQELVDLARWNGVGVLAITDHNSTADLTDLRRNNPDICLIQGAEMSCLYGVENREIHVVALGFDPEHPAMVDLFRRSRPDRHPYINAILDKLRGCGIDVGSYEDIQRSAPESDHFGRLQIAKEMVRLGYVNDTDEAYDEYIGAFGRRRAYVPKSLPYPTLEETVAAILAAGGVAVLAHLFYYSMEVAEMHRLVSYFKTLAGDRGGMETEYACYTRRQRDVLRTCFAERYGLMASCASDFHDTEDGDTLANQFRRASCASLLEVLL